MSAMCNGIHRSLLWIYASIWSIIYSWSVLEFNIKNCLGLFASSLPTLLRPPSSLPSLPDMSYTLLVTIYGVASRLLLAMALKLETAGLVAMIYSLAYEVMSYFLQIVWFKQIPQPLRLVGAGILVITVLALTAEKHVTKIFNCRKKKTMDEQCLIQK